MAAFRKRAAGCIALLAAAALAATEGASGASQMPEERVAEIAEEVGGAYGISPEFLQAIAWEESRYCPGVSNGKCVGLMQVNASLHAGRLARLGVSDPYDPYGNVLAAADYLSELFRECGDPAEVLMRYNGDSRAASFGRGERAMSEYASDVLEKARELEGEHGKLGAPAPSGRG